MSTRGVSTREQVMVGKEIIDGAIAVGEMRDFGYGDYGSKDGAALRSRQERLGMNPAYGSAPLPENYVKPQTPPQPQGNGGSPSMQFTAYNSFDMGPGEQASDGDNSLLGGSGRVLGQPSRSLYLPSENNLAGGRGRTHTGSEGTGHAIREARPNSDEASADAAIFGGIDAVRKIAGMAARGEALPTTIEHPLDSGSNGGPARPGLHQGLTGPGHGRGVHIG